jgi:hypothetical protein
MEGGVNVVFHPVLECLDGKLVQLRYLGKYPRVVDENVELAKCLQRRLHSGFGLVLQGNISGKFNGRATGFRDFHFVHGVAGQAATKTDAPSLANFLLTASPMPVPPPVTIATFPAIVLTMLVLYLSVVGDLAAGELLPPLVTAQAFNARRYPLFGSKRTAYGTFATLSPPVRSARCASEKSQRSSLFC